MTDISNPDLRFFVNDTVTAYDVLNQIKNLYPKVKEEKDAAIFIQIVLEKGTDPSIIEEIGRMVTEEEILEFRDSLFFVPK